MASDGFAFLDSTLDSAPDSTLHSWPQRKTALDGAGPRAYDDKTLSGMAMSDSEKPQSPPPAPLSPQKIAEKLRLAEALRENLRRRKAQARGRRAADDGNSGSDEQ